MFNFILRVVGIALTFSVDTSGCERLISLMNDLKTKFQEKMAHETLRDLVWFGGRFGGTSAASDQAS